MLGKAEGEGRPNTGPGRYGWCCGTKVSAQDAVFAIWQTITSIVHTLLDNANARR